MGINLVIHILLMSLIRILLLQNWWQGLLFFLHYSFYQGRRDTISIKVENAAMQVLNKYIKGVNENELLHLKKDKFHNLREDLKQVIGKGKIGRGRDIQMIISILDFVCNLEEKNLTKHSLNKIKDDRIEDHYNELQEIISIGPKITSLYFRDLICLYSLEKHLSKEDLVFCQPIDTWLRKVVYKIGIISDIKMKDLNVREKIVEACLRLNVSPIKFNQGAWYVGYYSFDIVLENLDKI